MRWTLGTESPAVAGAMAACLLVSLIPIGVTIIRQKRSLWFLVIWAHLVLGVIVILAGTVSRGGLLAAIIGSVMMFFYPISQKARLIIFAVLIITIGIFLVMPNGLTRIRVMGEGVNYPGWATRSHLYKLGIITAIDNPIYGVNESLNIHLGALALPPKHLGPNPIGDFDRTLNDFIDMAALRGLFAYSGMVILYSLLLSISWAKRGTLLGQVTFAGVVAWCVAGMSSSLLVSNPPCALSVSGILCAMAFLCWYRCGRDNTLIISGLILGLISSSLTIGGMYAYRSFQKNSIISPCETEKNTYWLTRDPTGRVLGTIFWMKSDGEDLIETLALPMNSLSLQGWAVCGPIVDVESIVELQDIMPRPHLVIGRSEASRDALKAESMDVCILCQPEISSIVDVKIVDKDRILVIWGEPVKAMYSSEINNYVERAGMERITFQVGSLWLNRFPKISEELTKSLMEILDKGEHR